MRWREENGVEDYLSQFMEDGKDKIIRRCIPTGWAGFDKQVGRSSALCDPPAMPDVTVAIISQCLVKA